MPFDSPTDPLRRFPIFRTTDPDEFRDSLLSLYGASGVEVCGSDSFRAWANYVQLENIALGFAGCSTDIALHFPEMEYVRYQVAVAGSAATTIGGKTTEVDGEHACTTSLGRSMTVRCEAGHERLTLRIKTEALEQKLAALIGAKLRDKLEFVPCVNLADPKIEGLLRLTNFLAGQLNSTTEQLPPVVVRELEQAIIVQFLIANQHRYSGLLEEDARDGTPTIVRLAEEFIEANWNEPITIDTLAAITNVSARTLFRSFRRARNYSPMDFARMTRLRRARDFLSKPQDNTSVMGVAFACGFGSVGHFAGDYRKTFGELPSETLARSRKR